MKSLPLFAAIFVLICLTVGFFVYLSLCVVVVKQGTRKIVERFGVYRKTLSEGFHFIWRPFDKIAPVPWEVLTIDQRDAYNRDLANHLKNTEFGSYSALRDAEIEKLIRMDIGSSLRSLASSVQGGLDENFEFDANEAVINNTGKDIDALISSIMFAEDRISALKMRYRELGIQPADKLLLQIEKSQSVFNNTNYLPRHQDPKTSKRKYPLAQNEVLDYLDLRERHIDSEMHPDYRSQEVITKDNALIHVNTIVFFYITDCYMYYYGAEEPERAMALLTISTLRNAIASLTLEEALESRNEINKVLRETLDKATNTWGIKVSRVEIKEFIIDEQLKEAMNTILISERKKRTTILLAEGEARSIELTRAAQAEGFRMIAESGIDEKTLKIRQYEALEKVADGKATKVFLPSDMGNIVTGAHVLADAFKEETKEQTVTPVDSEIIDKR